jgi:hypothetical protein
MFAACGSFQAPGQKPETAQETAKKAAAQGVFAQGIFTVMAKLRTAEDLEAAANELAQYIKEHPDEASGSTACNNVAFALRGPIDKNRQTPEKVHAAICVLEQAYSKAAPAAHAQFNHSVAAYLLTNDLLLPYAAEIESGAIAVSNEKSYVDIYRIDNEYMQKARAAAGMSPGSTFNPDSVLARFPTEMARMVGNLGEINLKLRNTGEASSAFEKSLKIRPTMEAYRGLSSIAESRGEKAKAFDLLCDAFLTGKLPKADIARLQQMFAAIKGGNENTLEIYLDDRYRKALYKPLKTEKYQPAANRTKRVALVELFTGAACEPCIPVDLSVEGGLERYRRDELAVLVYHDNAPRADPLSNAAVQQRAKYYATGGSTPHLFIDGKEVRVIEEASRKSEAFASFSQMVDKCLLEREGAQLTVTAKRSGSRIEVSVAGDIANSVPAHLQIALVETELSYSGENGLRFQPMVVRATAKQTNDDSGFPAAASGAIHTEYVFDLDAITAANLRYYDEYDADLKTRTGGRISADYREKKYVIDPTRLAVVAFLQQDTTKDVLQSAYGPVVATLR